MEVSEQALCGILLGFGIAVEDKPSELSSITPLIVTINWGKPAWPPHVRYYKEVAYAYVCCVAVYVCV